MAVGVKESLELLEGVKVLGVAVKKIAADGKLNLSDLPLLFALLQDFGKLSAAVAGLEQIPAEVKDLSVEESNQLVAKVLEVVGAIRAA